MEHGLCPNGLVIGWWSQLENGAQPSADSAAASNCCTVESALIVSDQASIGDLAIAACWFWAEPVEYSICPSGMAIGGWC